MDQVKLAIFEFNCAKLEYLLEIRRQQHALEASMRTVTPPTPADMDAALATRASSPHMLLRLQAD